MFVDYWGLVIPLSIKDSFFNILNPFSLDVWIVLLITIPVYMLSMAITDYVDFGSILWNKSAGLVIRIALHNDIRDYSERRFHQKFLIIIWMWSFLVLAHAYGGNLTAMIAIPSIHKPIENVEELINQDELSWFFPSGTSFYEYLKDAPSGSKMGKLFEGAVIVPYDDCYTARKTLMNTGKVAAPCIMTSIRSLLDDDFTHTSKCNFYTTSDIMHHMNLALAFQVSTIISIHKNT